MNAPLQALIARYELPSGSRRMSQSREATQRPYAVRRAPQRLGSANPGEPAPRRGFMGRLVIAFFRVMAVTIGTSIAGVLYTMPVLAVTEVDIRGQDRLSAETILALADVEGRNVLTLDLPGARGRLLSNPWVRDATAQRRLPAAVNIRIDERRPAAVWQTGNDRFLMAEDGVLLEPASGTPELPVIVDLDVVPRMAGEQAPRGPAALAQDLGRELPKAAGETIAGFEYQSKTGLTVVTSGGLRVVFGNATDLALKLAVYREVVARDEINDLRIREIDVRFGLRPVLRPAETPTPQAAVGR